LRAHYLKVSGDAAPPPQAAASRSSADRGFIIWFTGLSGAGKSTLAEALRKRLDGKRPIEILDGDEVRTHLSKGLGFSKEDRDTNIRRIGFVARLLARNGAIAIGAAISPYADTRDEVRKAAERDGVGFIEVHAHATIEALAERDVKGLYKKALAGEIGNFTGVSDPYEAPPSPDVVVRSDRETIEESLDRILTTLADRGLVDRSVIGSTGVGAGRP
jgi:adenylylsulfate kinase